MRDDKIELKEMVFYGFHGNSPAEQEVGQRFVVDLDVFRDLSAAGRSDDLKHTVSYVALYNSVKEIVEGPNRKLLENLAEAIAQSVLADFDIESVKVAVRKPEVPIKGSILSYAGVEISRGR